MWTRNKHKHTARRPHLQKGASTQSPQTRAKISNRKDKKVSDGALDMGMNLLF